MVGVCRGYAATMAGTAPHSSAHSDGAPLPRRHPKDGEDVSRLRRSRLPDGTGEPVLTCEHPNAPTGTLPHSPVTGTAPRREAVATGATPAGGVPHSDDLAEQGRGGPRPPAGDEAHRYRLSRYALPRPGARPEGVVATAAHRAVGRRQLAEGTLVGRYQR